MNVQQRTYAVVRCIEESSNRPAATVGRSQISAIKLRMLITDGQNSRLQEIRGIKKAHHKPNMGFYGPFSKSINIGVKNAVKGQERCIAAENKAEAPSLTGSIDSSQQALVRGYRAQAIQENQI